MDLLASSASAMDLLSSTIHNAIYGTLSASQQAQIDAQQGADIVRAGGTPQDAVNSIAEVDRYLADNYPPNSPVDQLKNALPAFPDFQLPDFSGLSSQILLIALVVGAVFLFKALVD